MMTLIIYNRSARFSTPAHLFTAYTCIRAFNILLHTQMNTCAVLPNRMTNEDNCRYRNGTRAYNP